MKHDSWTNVAALATRRSAVLLFGSAAGFVMLMMLERSVLVLCAALLLAACLVVMLRWSQLGTLVVLFAIYSNIGVLAMRSPKAVQQAAGSLDQNPRIAVVLGALTLLLCVPLVYEIFVRKQKLVFDRGFLFMLAFLAACLASSVFARDPRIVASELTNYLLEGIVLYFLIVNVIRDLPTLRRAVWTVLLAGAFMAGLSLLHHVAGSPEQNYGGLAQVESDFKTNPRMPEVSSHSVSRRVSDNGEVQGQLRAAGPIGETNRYGQILLVLLPFAVFLAKTESRTLRIVALAAGAVVFGGLLLTYSRGNLLALCFAFVLMACWRFLGRKQIVGGLVAACLLVLLIQPGVVSRMVTLDRLKFLFVHGGDTAEGPDSSAVRRYVENVAAWHVFLDHPVLGVGPGHFAAYYSNDYSSRVGLVEQTHGYRAHNLYFEMLAETGLIGFTCFFGILIAIAGGLWKERRRLMRTYPGLAGTATAFLISLSAYAASAIFAHLSYQRYFWLLVALSSAALRIIRSEAERRETGDPLPALSEA